MNAPTLIAEPPALNRARGEARIAVRASARGTELARLRQSGSAKAMTPRRSGEDLVAVLVNTAGGVTGGDRFDYGGEAEAGSALTLSTQAAERAYRARDGEVGRVSVALKAGEDARIDWLPQETILFDGAALARRLEADLAPGARLLAAEPVILGRPAMGEAVRSLRFTDDWRIRRDGRLIYADALRLIGDAREIAARRAVLDGAGAFASLALFAPDGEAEALLAPLRALLPETAGASLIRPGVLAARIAAPTGFDLRRALIPALELLRGAPLPTVWRL